MGRVRFKGAGGGAAAAALELQRNSQTARFSYCVRRCTGGREDGVRRCDEIFFYMHTVLYIMCVFIFIEQGLSSANKYDIIMCAQCYAPRSPLQ